MSCWWSPCAPRSSKIHKAHDISSNHPLISSTYFRAHTCDPSSLADFLGPAVHLGAPFGTKRAREQGDLDIPSPTKVRMHTQSSPSMSGPGAPAGPHRALGPFQDPNLKERSLKVTVPVCIRGHGLCPLTGWAICRLLPFLSWLMFQRRPFVRASSRMKVDGPFFWPPLWLILAIF